MGASTAHPVNTTVEAGLPNITGNFVARSNVDGSLNGAVTNASGALTMANGSWNDNPIQIMDSKVLTTLVTFDASRSNPIYGASTTVQPPAYYLYIWKRIE